VRYEEARGDTSDNEAPDISTRQTHEPEEELATRNHRMIHPRTNTLSIGERDRERGQERERKRETETEQERETERETERGQEIDRDREREKGRERQREVERNRERDREREHQGSLRRGRGDVNTGRHLMRNESAVSKGSEGDETSEAFTMRDIGMILSGRRQRR
jgi:hypothetical protein